MPKFNIYVNDQLVETRTARNADEALLQIQEDPASEVPKVVAGLIEKGQAAQVTAKRVKRIYGR